MHFDSEARTTYWQEFVPQQDAGWFEFHIAGADLDTKKKDISSYEKMYLWYRFLFEKFFLSSLLKKTLQSRDRALDCGSGTGRHTVVLGKLFDRVDAFDIGTKFVQACNTTFKHIKNIHFSEGDFSIVSRMETIYNLIHISGVFMCMSDTEVKEAIQHLQMVSDDDTMFMIRDTIAKQAYSEQVNSIKYYRSLCDEIQLLESSGLSVIAYYSGANRNVWCSVFRYIPKSVQSNRFMTTMWRYLIALTVKWDVRLAERKKSRRHPLASQVFFVCKKHI